jgi:phosphoribosylamine--glycine ligase
VIEEFLSGIEFSVFALTDGSHYVLLPEAKDYKRIGEGDQGLNTGGMGAVSPVPFVDQKVYEKVLKQIIDPTIHGLNTEKIPYKGFVFFGLILVNNDPYVIEYNCRLGDPETEAILPRLRTDLVELLNATWAGTLDKVSVEFDSRYAVSIILASGGYPESYEKEKVIKGLELVAGSRVYHAGTKTQDENVVTAGGRVMAITSLASTLEGAIEQSLINAKTVQFEGKYFRRDIGKDLL